MTDYKKSSELFDEVQGLIRSNFYLTGSRYFGTANEDSDWDFIAPYKNIERFHRCGYERIENSYKDNLVCVVYRHKTLPIDIQYVKNLEWKMAAQQFISSAPVPLLTQDKKLNSKVWNWALKTVNAISNYHYNDK